MKSATLTLLIGAGPLLCSVAFGDAENPPGAMLEYTGKGLLQRPVHYREWVYLTSGFDMSYEPAMQMGRHAFDNVFVDPAAYKVFLAVGTWPDKTVLVIENRGAESKGSINRSGHYQGSKVEALEVHVKDEARFPGKWAFFVFQDNEPVESIPRSAACYSCHAAHAAVDTTFVQFYPTLLPIARGKGTVSAAYLKDVATENQK